ncbi:putative enzyme [Nitrospira tepida]|uniref:Enzyme n=1 Tax=Nitrospira tepida TaxID=2973512 RepID=A0AA86TDC4_9BACT|nr:glycosyltransferase family 4 protein [Nitrospira tepida]CAI4032539.1 putative enzyme [Nitrospira tepida]
MIKVCHVTMGDLWAGAEVQLLALVDALVKRPDLECSIVLLNEGRLASELRALGVSVTVFPETKWHPGRLLRELTAYCRAGKFDLLHTHKYKDTILGTIAAARCGIRHVVRTVHGLTEPFRGVQSFRMGLYELCDSLAIRLKVGRLIAVSSQIEQVLSRRYGPEKVVQIHNGVQIGRIQRIRMPQETRQLLGIDPAHRLIGTVGRLTAVKGHEHFLEAAQRLLRDRRDLRFVIVGDGPLLDHLQDQARQLGVADYVTFLGHRDDTYDLIGAMDLFVLPSLHEGIPMVLLEALTLARPVVASRVGGIPEVITDSIQGLLIPTADPTALAEACRRFLDDERLAERCGRAGLLRVQEDFSAESMGEKVAALYRELVRRTPAG